MGIDFMRVGFPYGKHASWAYGGFHAFRQRIAREIGLDLDGMRGFHGSMPWPDHPLVPFLNHSDCDGELSAKECATIEPALRKIVERWPAEEYDSIMGMRLCKMMRQRTKAPLEFM